MAIIKKIRLFSIGKAFLVKLVDKALDFITTAIIYMERELIDISSRTG